MRTKEEKIVAINELMKQNILSVDEFSKVVYILNNPSIVDILEGNECPLKLVDNYIIENWNEIKKMVKEDYGIRDEFYAWEIEPLILYKVEDKMVYIISPKNDGAPNFAFMMFHAKKFRSVIAKKTGVDYSISYIREETLPKSMQEEFRKKCVVGYNEDNHKRFIDDGIKIIYEKWDEIKMQIKTKYELSDAEFDTLNQIELFKVDDGVIYIQVPHFVMVNFHDFISKQYFEKFSEVIRDMFGIEYELCFA